MDKNTKWKILFVDDDEGILHSVRRELRKLPYEIAFAHSGKEGLEILAAGEYHLVLSDHKMPEMSGTAFIKKVKQMYPGIVRAMISGYADMSIIVEAINEGEVYRFIPKPWKKEMLIRIIEECLVYYEKMNAFITFNEAK